MVALAGCHQLWTFDPVAATLTVLLGTADEGLPDDGPGEAFFAQPFTLRVRFSPPEGQHVDRRFGEPTSLTVTALDGFLPAGAGTAPGLERELRLDGSGLARVDAVAAACDGDGVFAACHRYRQQWAVDVHVRPGAPAELSAYQELLDDAMHGDPTRFAREDYVEEAWRIVQPILDNATPVRMYDPGTWGPAEAEKLTSETGGWRNPR